VDEMYEQYLADPSSVSESWREFFADYRKEPPAPAAPTPATPAPAPAAASAAAAPAAQSAASAGLGGDGAAEPLRGAAARIVANMEASLGVPTATSFREVPARLLEVNRSVINGYLGRTRGGKVSFTHLIGYAVVRAIIETVPVMNSSYTETDGRPAVVHHQHLGLGIAVDVEKPDGSRTLVVPVIKQADTLDFRGFWQAYEELIRKVRSNKLSPDDFVGATVTLTNPGTIRARSRSSVCRRSWCSARPTTTASSRVPSRGCSCAGCTSCCSAPTVSTTRCSVRWECRTPPCSGGGTPTRSTASRRCSTSRSRSTR